MEEVKYKFTENAEKKQIFIEELKRFPNFEKACAKIGIVRSTGYRWRERDPEFNKAIDDAKNQGVDFINDMAEAQLISAIRDKNLRAIIFWLRSHSHAYATKIDINGRLNVIDETLTEDQQKLIEKALSLSGLINKEVE